MAKAIVRLGQSKRSDFKPGPSGVQLKRDVGGRGGSVGRKSPAQYAAMRAEAAAEGKANRAAMEASAKSPRYLAAVAAIRKAKEKK